MKAYRLSLLDQERRIEAPHRLDAGDDETTRWTGEGLYHACSDVCSTFEPWRMARKLDGVAGPRMGAEAVTMRQ